MHSQVERYCIKCSYRLFGLTEDRCPECGLEFDPNDPLTFKTAPAAKKSMILIVWAYLAPLVPAIFVLQIAVSPALALKERLLVSLWQASGPLAWVIEPFGIVSIQAYAALVVLIWIGWLALVRASSLRKLPYHLHFVLSTLWCFAACPPVYVGV